MKQAADTFTQELPGLGNSLTESAISDRFKYRFHIRTTEGAVIEWTGLTRKRARDMYAYTEQSQPGNVTAFGWEELK